MIIYFKGATYDIPIQNDWDLSRVIDGTLSSGYVKTAPLEDIYGDLDIKRRIPRGLVVKLERNSRTFYMMTGEVVANQVTYVNGKYEHMINLIGLEKQLQRIPLENMTVTQPKGDLGTYTRSVNNIAAPIDMTSSGAANETVTATPTYINTINDNASIIDGLEIKQAKLYAVSLRSDLSKAASILNRDVTIRIKYNGSVVATNTVTIPALVFKRSTVTDIINVNFNLSALATFSVEYEYETSIEETITIESSTLSISAIDVVDKPIQTYAMVIDKVLRQTPYVLSPQSRARLNLTCSEHKFEEFTVYDALSTLAGEVGAIVKVGDEINQRLWKITANTAYDVEGDSLGEFNPYDWAIGTIVKVGIRNYINAIRDDLVREINFEFFDRPNVVALNYNAKHDIAELEDYTSAVELNTKNVVKPLRYSPFKNGWKGVRSEGIGKQSTDNILYELEDNADKIISVKVKGRIGKNSAGTTIYTENDVTDITSRVVSKKLYDTLSSGKNVDYSVTGKKQLRKHNTLYHEQGSNVIGGLTYYGEDLSLVVGNAAFIRAVYEAIDAVRSIEQDELITLTGTTSNNDLGIDEDIKLRFQVTYANLTESRARVYKDDQSGFEKETIKYLNESANINESQAIGDYAQLIVNRLGGTKTVYRGIASSFDELPEVGDINSEGKVYTLIKTTVGRYINYEITAVQDYNIISSYIGIVSRHRNEEISSSDSVLRTLRYTSRFIFIPTAEAFTTRLITSEDILSSLVENTDMGLNYAYAQFNLSNGSNKKVHLSVDSDNKGKTIEIKARLKDNYSAGLKRYTENIGGVDVYLNKEVEYTDLYGKVNDMSLFIYYDTTAFSTADDEAYPEALSNKGDTLFTVITDTIDKDARETIATLVEIPLFSQDPEIQVYNGMAKHNKLVEGTDRIRTALLKYVPRKNDKLVDTTRIVDLSVSGTYTFGQLNFSFTALESGNGVVWYHEDTLELVMAYIKDFDAGSYNVTKYYKVEDTVYGGGLNIVTAVFINYSVDDSADASLGISDTGTDNYNYSIVVDPGEDYSIRVSIDIEIDDSATASLGISTTGTDNVNYEIGIKYLDYQWVSVTGQEPTVNQTCDLSYDELNVKCDTQTPSACSWVTVGGQYTSGIDLSDNVGGSCFIVPSTKTECAFLAGQWYCQDYEAVITDYDYSDCFICTAVEVEM